MESTKLVEDLRDEPLKLPSRLPSIHAKFEMVVKDNCGFGELCTVRDLHHGEAQGRALENTEDLPSVLPEIFGELDLPENLCLREIRFPLGTTSVTRFPRPVRSKVPLKKALEDPEYLIPLTV